MTYGGSNANAVPSSVAIQKITPPSQRLG